MTRIVTRKVPIATERRLLNAGVHPLLSRLYAARGIAGPDELDTDIKRLLPPSTLLNADAAAQFLADAIASGRRLLIVADYDCDGATACAVGLHALAAMGAKVEYLVPNRFTLGYGLTPEVVAIAAERRPDVIITVDNGIASIDGVDAARRAGIATLVTDHHLPGESLPRAECIVNPNQPGDAFPSKSMAGVGVMFYVMLATRAELRRRGAFADRAEPNLAALLDLVALGTIADVVKLDANNRILVSQGLARVREGRLQPGIAALFAVAGRDPRRATAFDLSFALAPRLNAAGRLADMSLGIECLVTNDMARALDIARQLDALNRERRDIEADMLREAEQVLESAALAADDTVGVVLHSPGWHQGVIGIVAARVKDRLHRPVFAFAPGEHGELKGSGRSIPGLHLRDALDLVSKREPALLRRFGGHAAAAGATIAAADLDRFRESFDAVVRELVDAGSLGRVVETDGSLEAAYAGADMVRTLDAQVWGQGFPQPTFADEFAVESQRVVGSRHMKLTLIREGRRYSGIMFRRDTPLPERVRAAYRIAIDEYNGGQTVQLQLEHVEEE